MPIALYMDVNVPAAITQGLRRRGVDVLTAQEDGAREFDDDALLFRASSLERTVFTPDDDLLTISTEWQMLGREFTGVIYAHQLGPGIGLIVEDLELIAACAEAAELTNRVVYLPLR